MDGMKNETNERWVVVVPATPLIILFLAIISAYLSSNFNALPLQLLHAAAVLILQVVFPLTPFHRCRSARLSVLEMAEGNASLKTLVFARADCFVRFIHSPPARNFSLHRICTC